MGCYKQYGNQKESERSLSKFITIKVFDQRFEFHSYLIKLINKKLLGFQRVATTCGNINTRVSLFSNEASFYIVQHLIFVFV